jgi:hypothetical protein
MREWDSGRGVKSIDRDEVRPVHMIHSRLFSLLATLPRCSERDGGVDKGKWKYRIIRICRVAGVGITRLGTVTEKDAFASDEWEV